MKKLILIGGVLASGKSTYSMILKDKYDLNVINKDKLKEILGDNIYVTNREENKKLSVICFDIMKYLIESNQGILVLECNFKRYELEELKELCTKLDYEVMSLVFDGSNEILHKRFLTRLNKNRHYVHKSQDFTLIEDFIQTIDELRNVDYFGEIINVNCDDFSYQNDEDIFKKIEEFIEKNRN